MDRDRVISGPMERDQVIADLKRDEGFVPHVYEDQLGYLTIGYGFMCDERKGGGIPRHVAEYWLRSEVEERIKALQDALPSWGEYPEGVKRALVNMSYQMGVAGVLGFQDMLRALNRGDYAAAADAGLDSVWASEKQTPERARRVTEWIRTAQA